MRHTACRFVDQTNPGQKTTGQKTTGQKTTKNVNRGQKTTRTKDHQDKRPPSWFFYREILSHLTVYSFIREQVKQESPANAKGSARQPWYIVRKYQIGPHLGLRSSINVIYTSLKSTFSALQFPR